MAIIRLRIQTRNIEENTFRLHGLDAGVCFYVQGDENFSLQRPVYPYAPFFNFVIFLSNFVDVSFYSHLFNLMELIHSYSP
jgi:hypothetical protein